VKRYIKKKASKAPVFLTQLGLFAFAAVFWYLFRRSLNPIFFGVEV